MARGPIKKRDYDDEIQKSYERIERLKGHIKEVEEIITNLKAEKEQANLQAIQEILKTTGMTTTDLLELAKLRILEKNGLTGIQQV
jgi:hypothetical protein